MTVLWAGPCPGEITDHVDTILDLVELRRPVPAAVAAVENLTADPAMPVVEIGYEDVARVLSAVMLGQLTEHDAQAWAWAMLTHDIAVNQTMSKVLCHLHLAERYGRLSHDWALTQLRAAATPPPDPANDDNGLVYVADRFIGGFRGDRQWVQTCWYELTTTPADDREVLARLIGHRRYGHDYAGSDAGETPTVHGPYHRHKLTPAMYRPTHAAAEQRTLRGWANQWIPLSPPLAAAHEQVIHQRLPDADAIYRLRPPTNARHEMASIHTQFHELVLVYREIGGIQVIVAADD